MTVMYDFDRLHEAGPDAYASSSEEARIELRINEEQVLETIWRYVLPRHGFALSICTLLEIRCSLALRMQRQPIQPPA